MKLGNWMILKLVFQKDFIPFLFFVIKDQNKKMIAF